MDAARSGSPVVTPDKAHDGHAARPKSFLDEALWALQRCHPEPGHTPGPDKIIFALQALTFAVLAVAEETSRT